MNSQLWQDHLNRQEILRTQPFAMGRPVNAERFGKLILETEDDAWLSVADPLLRRHMAVMGLTGTGKSKFIESICRHLIDTGNGFTFIDPHGDTAQAIVDYVAAVGRELSDDIVIPRFHYLCPSMEWLFALDPFHTGATASVPEADPTFFKEVLRDNLAAEIAEVLLRRYADQDKEVMRRLMHWLENALMVVLTPRADGRRLSFSDILAVLDPSHPDHRQILRAVNDRLPEKVRCRWDFFQRIGRDLDKDHYIESTINNLRAFLRTTPEAIFGGHAPAFDFADAIRNRDWIVVNLRASRNGVNERAAMALADFIIHQIKEACRINDAADQRVEHHLLVDEASIYLAEDLAEFLDQARKWRLSVCLSSQRLGQFDRGNIRVSPAVLDAAGIFVSFQQRDLDEVEQLGRYFAYPNLILSELTNRSQISAPENDRVENLTDRGSSKGGGTGRAKHRAETEACASMEGDNHSHMESQNRGSSSAYGGGSGVGAGIQMLTMDGQIVEMPTASTHLNDFWSNGDMQGSGSADAVGGFRATSSMRGTMRGETDSENIFSSETVTIKQTLVPGVKSVWDPTGQPRYAIPYQQAAHERLLTCLPDRFALCRAKLNNVEQTFIFHTADVLPPIADPRLAELERREFLSRLYASKSYMFHPTSVERAGQQRRRAFLGDGDPPQDLAPLQNGDTPPLGFV